VPNPVSRVFEIETAYWSSSGARLPAGCPFPGPSTEAEESTRKLYQCTTNSRQVKTSACLSPVEKVFFPSA